VLDCNAIVANFARRSDIWRSYIDAYPLNKNDITSFDFVVNQFFMKLFSTSDINIVSECQLMFNFRLPSEQLAQRKDRFISRLYCVWCWTDML